MSPHGPRPGGRAPKRRDQTVRRVDAVGAVDVSEAARGASTAVLILAVGGMLAPGVAQALPAVSGVVLTVVAVVAFTLAGVRVGDARVPTLHGALAASASHLLVLPLTLWFGPQQDLYLVVGTFVLAAVVGGAAGLVAGWRRGR